MEMSSGYIVPLIIQRIWRYFIVLLLLSPLAAAAQDIKAQYVIDEGKMVITLNIRISDSTLNNFVRNYNLSDLDLTDFIKRNMDDSLRRNGWIIEKKANDIVILSKQLNKLKSALNNNSERPENPEKQEKPENPERTGFIQILANLGEGKSGIPDNNASNQSGTNHFKNKRPFHADSTTAFYLRGHHKATEVFLAGSFTNWQNNMLPMQKTDSGWMINVKLPPGKYYYKFIADGHWMTDEDNMLVENDGDGNNNSVYYVPNKLFTLSEYPNAQKVILAGSFNKWATDDIIMEHTAVGWQVPMFLSPGTYTYRFVVDGNWMTDPANDQKVPNEYNDYNSFIAIGGAYLFRLNGYTEATNVVLSGSFNEWQPDQLHMIRTATGWELPYVLGPGNYEYKFVVDGKWITDPANPLKVVKDNQQNSYFILGANHTFSLKGFADAKTVYLAGDFDEWSSNTLQMSHEAGEWKYSVYLSPGKHLYKFVVDGKWKKDPDNPLWEDNDNSIIWQQQ